MATIEQIMLGLDEARNVYNLRRDLKSNIDDVKRRLAAGQRYEDVKAMQDRNVTEYKRRLAWKDSPELATDVAAGIASLGAEDYAAQRAELEQAVVDHDAITPKDAAEFVAALDSIDATITPSKVLYK